MNSEAIEASEEPNRPSKSKHERHMSTQFLGLKKGKIHIALIMLSSAAYIVWATGGWADG